MKTATVCSTCSTTTPRYGTWTTLQRPKATVEHFCDRTCLLSFMDAQITTNPRGTR